MSECPRFDQGCGSGGVGRKILVTQIVILVSFLTVIFIVGYYRCINEDFMTSLSVSLLIQLKYIVWITTPDR